MKQPRLSRLEYLSLASYAEWNPARADVAFEIVKNTCQEVLGEFARGWDESFDIGDGPSFSKSQDDPVSFRGIVQHSVERKYDAHVDFDAMCLLKRSVRGEVMSVVLSVNTSLLAQYIESANDSEPVLWAMIRNCFERLIECSGPHYALVDVGYWNHAASGWGFVADHFGVPWFQLQHQAEAENWNRFERDQQSIVRGVYWGQLLNPLHIERLGGLDAIRRCISIHGKPTYVVPMAAGNCFVKLSPGPMSSSTHGIRRPVAACAGEFRLALLRAGLLNAPPS